MSVCFYGRNELRHNIVKVAVDSRDERQEFRRFTSVLYKNFIGLNTITCIPVVYLY